MSMNSYEVWENAVQATVKKPDDLLDFDMVQACFAKTGNNSYFGKLLKPILEGIYGTEDIVYVLTQVANEFGIDLRELVYEDNGYIHTVKREVYNDE